MIKRFMQRFYALAIQAGATPDQAKTIASNKARRLKRKPIIKPAPIEGEEEEEIKPAKTKAKKPD
jgi:hypothetical protein